MFMRRRTAFGVLALTLAGAIGALASSYETVGTPTASNFVFDIATAAGVGRNPWPYDISIEISSGGGTLACLEFTNSTHAVCKLPGGMSTFVEAGDILSLTGSNGVAGAAIFQTLVQANSTGPSEVPEPSTFALIGLGLALPIWKRIRR
jgi:PEP-CTERM motif